MSRNFLEGWGPSWECGLREGFGAIRPSACQVSHQAPSPLQERTLGWELCFSETFEADFI